MSEDGKPQILVIKLSALGDFVLSTGPFSAIRKHHHNANITLLTTENYKTLAEQVPWFDKIEIDLKPSALNFQVWLKMRRFIRGTKWQRIYDLQHNDRTNIYFRFLPNPKPEWSGIVPGCSHPHKNPNRNNLHTIERQAEQLAIAGINETPITDLSWLRDDISHFKINSPFGILVPGGAEHRGSKRWPTECYIKIAQHLNKINMTPVLIGGEAEENVLKTIKLGEPNAINLSKLTSLGQIATLGRLAKIAVGNDTGPMHIVAAVNCPSVVLFSDDSQPSQTAPRGKMVSIIQKTDLSDLKAEIVIKEIQNLKNVEKK